jgi:hypothetical protein
MVKVYGLKDMANLGKKANVYKDVFKKHRHHRKLKKVV